MASPWRKRTPLNLTIIVHNNDGGGIFEYLPQKGTPHFDYLFSTAQGLDYSGLATLYGIDFVRVASNDELKKCVTKLCRNNGCSRHRNPHI